MYAVKKHCPNSDETIMGTLSQIKKNIRSTKSQGSKNNSNKKMKDQDVDKIAHNPNKFIKIYKSHVFIQHTRNAFSDQTVIFPYAAFSGNQFIMITCTIKFSCAFQK